MRREALLVLEDGRTFTGEAYGSVGETFGEAVFTTAMTGYQETLTDPSYHRQVVVQTAPHIGNTGVNDEDDESNRIWVAGYVVRDPARRPSNWRATGGLEDRLASRGCRRHLRHRHPGADPAPAGARRHAGRVCPVWRAIRRRCASACWNRRRCSAPTFPPRSARRPRTSVPAEGEHRFTVAALDLGIKRNVPRRLAARGVTTHVLPANSTIDDLLATGAGRGLLLARPR